MALIACWLGSTSAAQASAQAHAWTSAHYRPAGGVLSLRFDDGVQADYTKAFALLQKHGLTAGFAVVHDWIGMPHRLTLSQIEALQLSGNEIMCHSYTHRSDPTDLREFTYETAEAAAALRGLGLHISSFVQPGTWRGAGNRYQITSPGFHGTPEDALLRAHFAAYEAYIGYAMRTLPIERDGRYGPTHVTGDTFTLADLKQRVTAAIEQRAGLELLFHSASIGSPGRIGWVDVDAFLAWVAGRVAAGELTILTPTQQLYATPEAPVTTTSFLFATSEGSSWHSVDQTIRIGAAGGLGPYTISYTCDGGDSWTASVGDQVSVTISDEGSHHFQYFARDALTTECLHDAGFVNIDKTGPTASIAGSDDSWHAVPVSLTVTGLDTRPGAGVAFTEYRVDGGAWVRGGAITVPASSDHSSDGVHTVSCRAVDAAVPANTGPAKTRRVRIDTTRPVTRVQRMAATTRGGRVTFRYRVDDTSPGGAALSPKADVRIIVTKGSRVVARLSPGTQATNVALGHAWTCRLNVGSYRYRVQATDLAGNASVAMGAGTLVVR